MVRNDPGTRETRRLTGGSGSSGRFAYKGRFQEGRRILERCGKSRLQLASGHRISVLAGLIRGGGLALAPMTLPSGFSPGGAVYT